MTRIDEVGNFEITYVASTAFPGPGCNQRASRCAHDSKLEIKMTILTLVVLAYPSYPSINNPWVGVHIDVMVT